MHCGIVHLRSKEMGSSERRKGVEGDTICTTMIIKINQEKYSSSSLYHIFFTIFNILLYSTFLPTPQTLSSVKTILLWINTPHPLATKSYSHICALTPRKPPVHWFLCFGTTHQPLSVLIYAPIQLLFLSPSFQSLSCLQSPELLSPIFSPSSAENLSAG